MEFAFSQAVVARARVAIDYEEVLILDALIRIVLPSMNPCSTPNALRKVGTLAIALSLNSLVGFRPGGSEHQWINRQDQDRKQPMAILFLADVVPLLEQAAFTSVWAYLDPGAGSMLFQVVIAGLLSSMFFAKNSYHLVRGRLFAKKSKI